VLPFGGGTVRPEKRVQGRPSLQVSAGARWVANGFAAGYARASDPRSAGVPVAEEADEGIYRVLLEGLESAMARTLPASSAEAEDERNRRYAVTADGRRYLTTAPSLTVPVTAATKDEWWRDTTPEPPRTMVHRPLRR
jgi:hypothetical protein